MFFIFFYRQQVLPICRGVSPSPRLAALASAGSAGATGFFVIDPAEDCAAMLDVRQLLTSWTDGKVPVAR